MTDPPIRRTSEPASEVDISLYALFSVLLEYRYVIAALTFGTAVVVAGVALLGPRKYAAEATFMPQATSRSTAGSLATLAMQFGLNLPQGDQAQSPQFYAELLGSRELLGRLLADTFMVSGDPLAEVAPVSGTLADFLEIEEPVPARRREKTIRALSRVVAASTTRESGMVHLRVTTRWAELSHAAARRLIELVNEFNLQTRQSSAAAESRFVEGRLAETEANLRRAEEEFRAFLEANRQWQNSPLLVFEHDRLERQVLHQQQLYTGLQQSLETARIAQVRDTPVITVVEAPQRPALPVPRRIRLRAVLGALLGGSVAILLTIAWEFLLKRPPGRDPEYERFRRALRDSLRIFGIGRGDAPASTPRQAGTAPRAVT